MYLQPKVLAILLTAMQEQQQMQEASPAISQAQKKLQGGDPGNETQEAKKLQWQKIKEQCQENWKENGKFDATLKATKQKIQSTHTCTNMGALMQAHGLGITDALKKIVIPLTTCGWFLLWGGCGDPTCTLKHENMELKPNQVATANEILSDGAFKLKKPPQN